MIDLKDGFAHEETIVGVCHLVERGISCDPTEAWVGDGVIELLDSGERFGGSLLDVVSDAAGKDFDLVWLLQIFGCLGEDLGQIPQAGCFLDVVVFIPAVENTSACADICLEV